MPRVSHPTIFLALVFAGLFLLYPFVSAILLAAITAYTFRPLVKRLETHTRSYHLALAIIAILIGAPFIIFSAYLAGNVAGLINAVSAFGQNAGAVMSAVLERLAQTPFGPYISGYLNAQNISNLLTQYAVSIVSAFVHDLPTVFLDIIIYAAATYYFLRDGPRIVDMAKQYANTLPHDEELLMLSIVTGLKRSFDMLFVSYIVVSVITSIVSFVGYSIFGVPHAAPLALLTGIFGFLPVFGTWMIYGPIAAYMYYAGNVSAAIGVLVFGVAVLNIFIPLVLQPYLGAKKSGVSPLTVLLGFFAGPAVFGAKGLILGPVLLVVIQTAIREYVAFKIKREANPLTRHAA